MKLLRTNIWWNAIVPQVLGWIYFLWLTSVSNDDHFNISPCFKEFCLFFISLLGISAFGYLFNDFCDEESDRISGKKNLLSEYNRTLKIVFVILPAAIGIISWIFLRAQILANILFAFQIVSLVLYSAKPFRFKNRGIAGVLTDAFYGHLNPVLITLVVFGFFDTGELSILLYTGLPFVLIAALFLNGIRNILLHQIDDRKKDKKAELNTFVVKCGALFSLNFTNSILRLEMFFTLLLAIIISIYFPPFFLSILLFGIVSYLKFSGWRLIDIPERQLRFKFLYFLNDYYEGWIPVSFLLLLSIQQPEFFNLLILHLVVFPDFIFKLWEDLETIHKNFKTEED